MIVDRDVGVNNVSDHGNEPKNPNFDDPEIALAPKGVVVIVPHGLCGPNGVAATIIKLGKGI